MGYVASTTLTVTGDPGETVPVTLGGLANPPVEPVLHYSMSGGLRGNEVGDTYGVINGVCTNIGSSRESSEGFGGSFVFQSDSAIRIGNHTGLDKDSEIGFSLDFKPSQASGTLVDFHLRSQKLAMEPDGRLRYEVETENGVFKVFSAPSNRTSRIDQEEIPRNKRRRHGSCGHAVRFQRRNKHMIMR